MRKLLRNHVTKHQKVNCGKKAECPMEGNRQANDIVYKCDVQDHYR